MERTKVTRISLFSIDSRHNANRMSDIMIKGHLDIEEILKNTFEHQEITVSLTFPLGDSPVRHIKKVRVQICHTYKESLAIRDSIKTLTTYGLNTSSVRGIIENLINKEKWEQI